MNNRFSVFLVLLLIVVISSCHSKKKEQKSPSNKLESLVQLETFRSGEGWGYEIKVYGKTKIKQPMIPAIQGNLPFDTETEARRVGELIVQKMVKGKIPTISKNELDSLHIKY